MVSICHRGSYWRHKLGDNLSGLPLGLWLIAAERALLAGAAQFTLWFGLRLEYHFCRHLPLYRVELCPPGVNEMRRSSGEVCRLKPLFLVLSYVLSPRCLSTQRVGLWALAHSGGSCEPLSQDTIDWRCTALVLLQHGLAGCGSSGDLCPVLILDLQANSVSNTLSTFQKL